MAMRDPLKGIRVRVIPMGCRTNISESEALCSAFAAAGSILVDEGPLDVVILVSCSVTAEADRKCRQLIRRLRRNDPSALILATGCWAQKASSQEASSLGLDCLVGNRLKYRIPTIVSEMLKGERTAHFPRIERIDVSGYHGWDPLFLEKPQSRTRAFIKIQDGCDHRCAYCIIPDLRGRPVERAHGEILDEVSRVTRSGCKEVVFTGINLGMYGRSSGMSLGELVRRTGDIEGIARIRFGSLEPFAITESLLWDLSNTTKFCHHLHIPLQSGDDGVLDRMRRGYSSEEFVRYVDIARGILGEDLHISTDIIAGFPGESEDAFGATLLLLSRVRVGRLHVFPFSPRNGTSAAALASRIPGVASRSRVNRALVLGRDLLDAYCRMWVGREIDILVEKSEGGQFEGLSQHFIRVESRGDAVAGEIRTVTVSHADDGVLKAFV